MPFCSLFAAVLLAAASSSGEPPSGPLERYDPKVYDIKIDCILDKEITRGGRSRTEERPSLSGGAVVMPLILASTYSEVDRASVSGGARASIDDAEVTGGPAEIREGGPFSSHLIEIGIFKHHSYDMLWTVAYRTRVYSAKIDDAAAAQLSWPAEWPDEVQEALKPQKFIESDEPIFAKAVEQVTKGKLRTVPPYLAAKELVRYCLVNFQVIDSGNRRRPDETLIGMAVSGAAATAREGKGTAHDLVCVCVATLRAAGIPARVVIGVQKAPLGTYEEFVSWAEFYLAGAGWIPFDPYQMDGKGEQFWKLNEAWGEFGTMKNLNDRIPLAFAFTPDGYVSPGVAGLWGWKEEQQRGEVDVLPAITFTISSRGGNGSD